ncbi:MAG TPA: carboxylating nicotinate-nucleotide diphosphorylase [Candidatus Paceibacterota bacterium]|nr:carboxylating nicotinate-nucleotide diphosphorylase [Candidatus Paceibacterota bacterium]
MSALTRDEVRKAVQLALDEDIGSGDATSLAVIPPALDSRANMVAREPMVVAGIALAMESFRARSNSVTMQQRVEDGQSAKAGQSLLFIEGSTQALLTAERVALNFIQRLSGVATLTAQYVRAIQGTKAKILDTRKTTPGWRRLEKYAVSCGGGHNHRFGLYDMILIKDNHLAALRDARPNPVAAAVKLARAKYPQLKVEVEADTVAQAEQAAEAGADIILLDNMALDQLRATVRLINGLAKTEASGGVNLQTVRAIAETGVDFISVGALTHSARSVDIGLDFVP